MKFKNTKTKKTYKKSKSLVKQGFPSNSRSIPEKLNTAGFAFLVGMLFILTSIFVISLDFYSNYQEKNRLYNEKIEVLENIVFWKNQIKERPKFRDAYFNLALLNYRLRNMEKANSNLEKTLELDPNFEKGRELQKQLE